MDINVKVTIEGIEGLAESIKILAGAVGATDYNDTQKPTDTPMDNKVERVPEPVKVEEKQSDVPDLTLTDVKKTLHALVQADKEAEVAALLKEFGASKLSDVAESDYAAVIEKAKAL